MFISLIVLWNTDRAFVKKEAKKAEEKAKEEKKCKLHPDTRVLHPTFGC